MVRNRLGTVLLGCLFLFVLTTCGSEDEGSTREHFAGTDCSECHDEFKAAGTVFSGGESGAVMSSVALSWYNEAGEEVLATQSNSAGNIAVNDLEEGAYIVKVGEMMSRTWHWFPDQTNCNSCHIEGGNLEGIRTKQFPERHTRVPADNDCTDCHHFPATMALAQLATPGVLDGTAEAIPIPGAQVEINGVWYPFEPEEGAITSVRPDIFAPGYFSMFDALLAVAADNNIEIDYSFSEAHQTHFINTVNGVSGDYWFHFSYDVQEGIEDELIMRRANRWDETLWRPGAHVQLVEGEDLDEIKAAYLEEIIRENEQGHVIPSVDITLDPSEFQGNPEGSDRASFTKVFTDVLITPHNKRAVGSEGLDSKPFQPGVVTSLDVPLTLEDMGELILTKYVHYTYFADNYIDGYYVVAMGFPDGSITHASGRHGHTYTTENGTIDDIPNSAHLTLHITSDAHVIHAPDFSNWIWLELGDPFYETGGAANSDAKTYSEEFIQTMREDHRAMGRGFNLYQPRTSFSKQSVEIGFNNFRSGDLKLSVLDQAGEEIAVILNDRIEKTGPQTLTWKPEGVAAGFYTLLLERGKRRHARPINVP
ncbi:MAG: hypothetical protein HQL52_14095 [Magnetococcales bacterium]|nr:hypothetical protein [Magnetococcales bacterium]